MSNSLYFAFKVTLDQVVDYFLWLIPIYVCSFEFLETCVKSVSVWHYSAYCFGQTIRDIQVDVSRVP